MATTPETTHTDSTRSAPWNRWNGVVLAMPVVIVWVVIYLVLRAALGIGSPNGALGDRLSFTDLGAAYWVTWAVAVLILISPVIAFLASERRRPAAIGYLVMVAAFAGPMVCIIIGFDLRGMGA